LRIFNPFSKDSVNCISGKKNQMVQITRVTDVQELRGIQALQTENLRKNVDANEAVSQGFLMAEYSLEFLQSMHQAAPSIIANDGNKVVGYALVATQAVRHEHDLLADLFNTIDQTQFEGKTLASASYVVVGQLCVSKDYRGQGLVQQLYGHFRECLETEYDFCITDVAQANARSLKAHKNTGYQVIDTLSYGGIAWDIVLWDWRK
jgi:ribosomal protein S18 acetylase RimI-like enzyme